MFAGTWNLESWQDMANGCFQWVRFTLGGLKEPRMLGGCWAKPDKSGVGKKATRLVVTNMFEEYGPLFLMSRLLEHSVRRGEGFLTMNLG